MTPQGKADSVVNKNKDQFTRRLKEAACLISAKRELEVCAYRMIEIIDEICSLTIPVATCKKGCDACCYQSVAISTWEAKKIAQYSGRKTTGFKGYDYKDGQSILGIQKKFSKIVCPFLIDNACAIYPVRPFTCRSHISLSDDPTDCDLFLKPDGIVTYFNLEEFKIAWALINLSAGSNFGDIRDFFG